VQQALEQSLAGQRASFDLRASYEPHEMLVQYRETDFAYVSRLMEDEGIFYFFRHAADGDELVLADGPQSYSDADDFERPWSNLEGQRTIQESVRLGSVEHRLALAANASLYGQPFDSVGRRGGRP